jgi:hypothetical protein
MDIDQPVPGALATISADDRAPKSRLSTASSARSLLSTYIQGDNGAAVYRTMIQSMIDGAAPFTDSELKAADQGWRSNVNWGGARARIRDYLTAYTDLVVSPDTIAIVRVRVGDSQQRNNWGNILSEEFSQMLLQTYPDWNFLFHMGLHHKQLAIHGIGPCFWPDKRDWRFRATKRRNILVPKESPSDLSRIPIVFIRDFMYVDEVFAHIRGKDRTGSKWNREAGFQAIKNAQKKDKDRFSWEQAEERWQDNSYSWSYNESDVVMVAHVFVKEFDGKISHQIFTENAVSTYEPKAPDNGYLYSEIGAFEHLGQAVWCCFQDVGNGDFESVRGLGMEAYQYGLAHNRINNGLVDNAITSGAVVLTADTAEHADKLTRIEIGPWRMLPPGVTVQQINTGAGVQAQLAVVNHFTQLEENNTGVYRTRASGSSGQARTATEVEAEIGQTSKLTNAGVMNYCVQGDELFTECFRRATADDILEKDGGGKAALDFMDRCVERGIPAEFFHEICRNTIVTMSRPVGNGSYSDRVARFSRVAQFMGDMPQRKRAQFVRDYISQVSGSREAAELYGPDIESQDPGMEKSLAVLENRAFPFDDGQDPFSADQAHTVHFQAHFDYAQILVQGEPQKAAVILFGNGNDVGLLIHAEEHLQMLKDDPTRRAEYDQFNTAFGDLMKAADDVRSVAEALAQSEQKQQQPSPEMMEMQMKAQMAQADMERKNAKTRQQLATSDAKNAQRLKQDAQRHAQQMAQQRQDMEIEAAKTRQELINKQALTAQQVAAKRETKE